MVIRNKQSHSTCLVDIIHKPLEIYLILEKDVFNMFLRLCDEIKIVRFTKKNDIG